MKLTDLREVQLLQSALKCISKASQELESQEEEESGPCSPVLQGEYYLHLTRFGDGSGELVDLSGCYITNQIVLSAKLLLQAKREAIKARLTELGVETDLGD